MTSVHPYFNFKGNTEEAFNFYREVFGGEFLGVVRYRDFGGDSMGVPESDLDKIAHIALPLKNGTLLMGTDILDSTPGTFTVGTNVYIYLEGETNAEAEALFKALSEGGNVDMPLQKTEWAEKYGSFTDRFGIQWMIAYTGDVQFPGSPEG